MNFDVLGETASRANALSFQRRMIDSQVMTNTRSITKMDDEGRRDGGQDR